MTRYFVPLFLVCTYCWLAPMTASAVVISTVPVGNAGNAADTVVMTTDGTTGYGSVDHAYSIGMTEVTNTQYAEFLNAKAAGSDPLGLYNNNMGSDPRGGLARSGVSGTFTYTPKTDMGNKPVNFVSWYDAIRFANWLNNGQGHSSTETGAYTILGGTSTPSNGPSIVRNSGAKWFLSSENEWYKAAYYDPRATSQGGPAGDDNYWFYPTSSNITPTMATANVVGDISNPGMNVANYYNGADWNGLDGNVTTVGSAGPLSQSFFGTSDQGGNVIEWNEALLIGSSRGLWGGFFGGNSEAALQSSFRGSTPPSLEDLALGFRMASVPEPGVILPFPDANADGYANFIDLGYVLNNFNQPGTYRDGDFDHSGTVDFIDLGILLNNFNESAPVFSSAAAVPEPSTLALAALGAIGLLIAARRKV